MNQREKYHFRKQHHLCIRCEEKTSKGIFCEKCKNRKHETDKALRERRKQNKLCQCCGKKCTNKCHCDDCRKKINKQESIVRKFRKENDLCQDCGKKSLPNEIYCQLCKNKRSIRVKKIKQRDPIKFKERKHVAMQKRREKCFKAGICWRCGDPVSLSKKMCNRCLCKRHGETKKLSERRLSQGLCKFCGLNTPAIKSESCISCFLTRMSKRYFSDINQGKQILLEIFEEQNGRCPYTNIALSLGVNATLDHIIASSNGGKTEKNNLQWVYYGNDFDVNMMKRNMSEENFIKAINTIYRHKEQQLENI